MRKRITEHRGLTKILFHDIEWYSVCVCVCVEESIRRLLETYSYVAINTIKLVLQEKLYSLVSITKSNMASAGMPVVLVSENQN